MNFERSAEPYTRTRYYDQAPAMNWDHAVSWGRGVWVSVSDIGRVGSGRILNSPPHSAQTLLLALRQNRPRDAQKNKKGTLPVNVPGFSLETFLVRGSNLPT